MWKVPRFYCHLPSAATDMCCALRVTPMRCSLSLSGWGSWGYGFGVDAILLHLAHCWCRCADPALHFRPIGGQTSFHGSFLTTWSAQWTSQCFPYWLINIHWDVFWVIIVSSGSFPYNVGNLLKIRVHFLVFHWTQTTSFCPYEASRVLVAPKSCLASFQQTQNLLISDHLKLDISPFMSL